MRSLIIFTVLLLDVFGDISFLNINNLPAQFKDLVPEEVKNFYAELTDQDKSILREIFSRYDKFDEQALDALKAKSEKLYNKANELHNLVKGKFESLKQEAKNYVESRNEQPDMDKLKTIAISIIEQYKALSEEAQIDLKEKFPKITSVFSSEKFLKLAKGFLDKPVD